MRIYLIGLPGVGKTTIAKVLSERLKWQYIDLDVAIEARENMQISEIFTLKGEPYFREKETKLLNELSEVPNLIISCGGGIVLNNTKNQFKGAVVYLKTDLDVLEKRLANDETRPLLKRNNIYELAKQRNSLYEALADIIIYNNDITETVNLILEGLKK